MVDFIVMFINASSGGLAKLVLRRNIVKIDSKEFSIDELMSIQGEIRGYTVVYEFDEESKKYGEIRFPHGYVKFTFRNGVELTYETVNPIVRVEELVVKLNLSFKELGLKPLTLKTSSRDKVVYQR